MWIDDTTDEFEFEYADMDLPFSEDEEMELAAELLEVSNEEELEYFLGDLAKKAVSATGKFLKSDTAKAIGGALKGVAKQALPAAGAAVGNLMFPGVGGAIGGKLAGFAANALEMEMEGMGPEDLEFEAARRIVRLAGAAGKDAAKVQRGRNAQAAAKTGITSAARKHAPGLVKPQQSKPGGRRGASSGRWMRKGNTIVVMGV
jgi:hypothetical protein